ncbi:MAG TPA: oxygen-independent coproporphyrinogen III oxidase [Burkholderiaceae bacterium]|nr:oxygen-independent coproporphyrinogen III oxidase [Burkholderiaceae bacterium]HMZ00829.1 oxygen-independent coproporphyrinogen III oxidase [Burkholderiaceae bacterium]HNB43023.1 oxygen-independent coproporphyrinogen III oxidase [Burkholderiaceae bacterium]HNG80280.1 oxygen-independent coproporphyrinogen III oxidase [Burkholderiaceae bacterium]
MGGSNVAAQDDKTPVLSDELLRRMDVPGPRYTSYPTADRFVEAFGPNEYVQALTQRASGGVSGGPLSLYLHVPFCESVCYYCACNKIVTKDHGRAQAYLEALTHELDLVTDVIGRDQPVSQLHFGGGTPTFLSDAELSGLMATLRSRVQMLPRGEYSIEIDPRTVTHERLAHLAELGFNRLSFGVQDFDAEVQKAVHRIQPSEQVHRLMASARSLGFESINVDLIYGLPKQTPESFERTVREVAQLRPDRIAMYGYAHLPARFKPQRRIPIEILPSGGDRIGMLSRAISGFIAHGYQYIGMDHFALPDDPLAQAKRQGRLHRNFQGYSTQPDCDLVALGVSAISRIGPTYSQNAKTLDDYYDALRGGRLPVVRGLALTRDDLVRRAVIMSIMCHGRLSYESVALAHLIDVRSYFAAEIESLREHADAGLLTMDDDGFELTPLGWYFVRYIAMAFDKYVRADKARERFSRVI